MLKIFLFALFPFTVLAYDHRSKEIKAALRRATHPGVNSALKLAQEVVQHLQDHEKWLSPITTIGLPDCPYVQNCSNAANAMAFFECLAANIQLIIKDCLEISNPDQLFDDIDKGLQYYLKNNQQISVICSADLSFHWTSLMKLATAARIPTICQRQTNEQTNEFSQRQTNFSDCSDLLKWAAKAQSDSLWALIRKKTQDLRLTDKIYN